MDMATNHNSWCFVIVNLSRRVRKRVENSGISYDQLDEE
jgi:hypothetical protein